MKSFSSTLFLRTLTACLAVAAVAPTLAAQDVPEPSSSLIRMRGVTADFSNSADTLLSLDLNGDGKADLLYYRPGGGYADAFLSHGDGTFRAVSYVSNGTAMNGFPGDLSNPNDRFVALDFNGDGKSDFIQYRPGSGYAFLCLSNGDGTVNCSTISHPNNQYKGFEDNLKDSRTRLVAADLNHDGRSDIIAYTPGGGQAAFYLSLPNGNFQAFNLVNNYTATASTGFAEDMKPGNVQVVALDANGDGYADLMVYTPTYGEVRPYQNNRNNTFQVVPLSYGGANGYGFQGNSTDPNAHLIALDLNGDGKSDFLWWQAGSHTVTGYLSNGNGSFTAVNYNTNGSTGNGFADMDSSTADTAVALDLNGDGKSDFLWYSPGNSIVTAYVSSASGQLTSYQYQTQQGNRLGFNSAPSSTADVILPLNFLGQASSGFVNYTPGSGNIWLNTPLAGVGPSNVSSYATRVYAQTFLTDLSWSVGNIPLKEIVMPGTHDSAMYAMTDGENDINETQWRSSLTDQLNAGARALDFRTGYFVDVNSGFYDPGGKLMIIDQTPAQTASGYYMYGHSNTLSNVTTQTSLNEIENWLVANPNEVVIVNLTNELIEGSQRDGTAGFVSLLKQTVHPELLYTPMGACGQTQCSNAAIFPQNVTPVQLISQNTRLIITGGYDELNAYGMTWPGEISDVGYCSNYEGGRSTAIDEIDCINNGGNESGSGAMNLTSVRPQYQAADAASTFMNLKAKLTPGGYARTGQVISLLPPLTLADGGDPYGFNLGSQEYDLNQQMANGAWNTSALNLWNIDGLRAKDDITRLILQRNDQTWANLKFLNGTQRAGTVSVGINGDVWAAAAPGGHGISVYKYNPATKTWVAKINSEPYVKKSRRMRKAVCG